MQKICTSITPIRVVDTVIKTTKLTDWKTQRPAAGFVLINSQGYAILNFLGYCQPERGQRKQKPAINLKL